jgi:hypothetical protein
VDHTPVYPREVVKRALELSATALILVHNHPLRRPDPSSADIKMTRDIIDSQSPRITIHDHIIVGREGHAGASRGVLSDLTARDRTARTCDGPSGALTKGRRMPASPGTGIASRLRGPVAMKESLWGVLRSTK